MKLLVKIAAVMGITGLVLMLVISLTTGKTSLSLEDLGIKVNHEGAGLQVGKHSSWFTIGKPTIGGSDESVQEGRYHTLEDSFEDIWGLDLECDLGDVLIMRSPDSVTRVTMTYRECQQAEMKVENGRLKIEMEHPDYMQSHNATHNRSQITIEVASDLMLEDSELELSLGDLTVEHVDFRNSKLELSLGDLDFSGLLEGDCKIESSLGDVRAVLTGTREDYRINASNSLGNLTVGSEHYSELSNSCHDRSGTHHLKVDSSLGDTDIQFTR